ncbi:EAL domain-containing protein [Shewanella intestini]|uniref:Cyclic diguanylate phosphodiesterase n=1 Tax=Shewanella intestini TaxID=2017544 RepID=A0ABS5I4L5_9GAMM|nr:MULTISPECIES: EAL domain-containing protein [Shewanella]MBR9728968.1 cyclic diguanylate phosphodiesterase [Shewanella intestini]MRG36966.1 EAL domain-containing protein [Shewanella sp. XMDDZSB0408]
MNKVKYSLIFITVCLLCTGLVDFIDRQLASYMITKDANLLTEKFSHLITQTSEDITTLPELNDVEDCNEALTEQLKMSVFNGTFIRWIGVAKNMKVYCESNHFPREIHKLLNHKINDQLSLSLINPNDDSHELLLIRHFDNIDYAVSIMPMLPVYFLPEGCKDCLEYSITFNSNPVLKFGFDNFENDPVITKNIKYKNQYFSANFSLSGNQEFFNQYRTISIGLALAIGLILATVITYLSILWHRFSMSYGQQIQRAINHKEFIPYYQPIIDSTTDKLVGCEVLMRWKRHHGELVPPAEYIPLVESTGQIIEMTFDMVDKMVADINHEKQLKVPIFFSINIVPAHLLDDQLLLFCQDLITNHRLGHHRLSLEITERFPIADLDVARAMLLRFFELGIDLKLDDAGTGYGSFSYIEKLGVSTIKIDKMFVDTIGVNNNFKAKTIEAIIAFSQESGLRMIAEGVETQAQVDYLAAKKVNYIQGFFYSKPLPAEEFFDQYGN